MWGAREEVTNEKKCVLESVFFSWFAHTGLYVTYVGGKGGSNKRKTTFLKAWFFRGLPIRASMSPMWGVREEVTNEKTTFLESVVFSWFAHTGLYVTYVGGKGGSNT